MESSFELLLQLGMIFNVQKRAAAHVNQARELLTAVQNRVAGKDRTSVLVAYPGMSMMNRTGLPAVFGGGIYDDIVARAGGSNSFAGKTTAELADRHRHRDGPMTDDLPADRSADAHARLAARDDLRMHGNEQIVMVLYDGFTALDLTRPQYFLASLMGAQVHLAATGQAGRSVPSDTGLSVAATISLIDIDGCDVLVVPGAGGGLGAALADTELLGHLTRLAVDAAVVASVCTGSMLLGAAGLLTGRRVTSHWVARPHIHRWGAVAVDERLVDEG